jgi:hypothetical protein
VAGTCKYSDELSGSGATELPYLRKLCKEFLEGVVLEVTFRYPIHKLEMKRFSSAL